MESKRDIIIVGMLTGLMVAIFNILNVVADVAFGSFATAVASFLIVSFLGAFATKKICETSGKFEPSMKQLLPVAFLTFILPLLGATFGLPNMSLQSLAILLALGIVGGAFWSLPLLLWSTIRYRTGHE